MTLADCLQLLREALSAPQPETLAQIQHDVPGLSRDGARRRLLLHAYRAIQQLTPWVGRRAAQSGAAPLAADLAALDADARVALHQEGLLGAALGAMLRGGIVDGEPGGYVGQPPDTPSRGTVSPFARVDFETPHVDLGADWDASLGVEFGREPLLIMARNATPGIAVMPAYRDGVIASQTVRFAKASRTAETAVVGRVGATRVDSASVAANDVAEWALLFDAGVELRWYDRDVWLAHLAAQTLDPLLRAYVGVRHDERFHRAGDLATFDDPTARVVFSCVVNPIRLHDARAEGSGRTLFTFGGGFEFEGALRGPTRLPSGFRLLIGGNLDLGRALRARPSPLLRP